MRFIPASVTRMMAEQALRAQKHSPELLFGAGIISMAGSTVMACRATLKLSEVLDDIQADKDKAQQAKEVVENPAYTGGHTYTDAEMKKDIAIITTRGVARIAKIYAPAIILGGVGVACLTKSHSILKDRNVALTAAYVAVDAAFQRYRERVVDRYGEEVDREFRHGAEEVDTIDEETGKLETSIRVASGEPSGYARWFDENNSNWSPPQFEVHNRLFLRNQQNWANDMLRARGHVFLNEVYSMVGLSHTSAGSIVGWVYDRHNERGDNYIDFGCWDDAGGFNQFFENGNDGAILLDFNVDGPIWQLIDERREKLEAEQRRLRGDDDE